MNFMDFMGFMDFMDFMEFIFTYMHICEAMAWYGSHIGIRGY